MRLDQAADRLEAILRRIAHGAPMDSALEALRLLKLDLDIAYRHEQERRGTVVDKDQESSHPPEAGVHPEAEPAERAAATAEAQEPTPSRETVKAQFRTLLGLSTVNDILREQRKLRVQHLLRVMDEHEMDQTIVLQQVTIDEKLALRKALLNLFDDLWDRVYPDDDDDPAGSLSVAS